MRGHLLTYTKIQWMLTFFILFIEVIWIRSSSIAFYYNTDSILLLLISLGVLFTVFFIYKYLRPEPRITEAIHLTIMISLFSYPMFILSYLVYTLNMPLIDSALALIDSYLGFSSSNLVYWSRNHLHWHVFFAVIYDMYYPELPFIIIYFYVFADKVCLNRFIMQVMLTILITIVIAGLLPSLGPYGWYPYEPAPMNLRSLNHIYELRQNILDIRLRDGVIAFPSLHAAMAFLYIYALRKTRKIVFFPVLLLNLLMIFSCLNVGEHYLADILGGAVVFLIVVGLDKLVFWAIKKYGTLESNITTQSCVQPKKRI